MQQFKGQIPIQFNFKGSYGRQQQTLKCVCV